MNCVLPAVKCTRMFCLCIAWLTTERQLLWHFVTQPQWTAPELTAKFKEIKVLSFTCTVLQRIDTYFTEKESDIIAHFVKTFFQYDRGCSLVSRWIAFLFDLLATVIQKRILLQGRGFTIMWLRTVVCFLWWFQKSVEKVKCFGVEIEGIQSCPISCSCLYLTSHSRDWPLLLFVCPSSEPDFRTSSILFKQKNHQGL